MKRFVTSVLVLGVSWHLAAGAEVHDAAKQFRTGKLAELLEADEQLVHAKDAALGATPLHWAAGYGRKQAAELLLSRGADVNARDKEGNAPLHVAASHGHKDMVELLLRSGADVNAKDEEGWTPLHIAASRGRRAVMESLLAHKAEINAKDKMGRTPLTVAAGLLGTTQAVRLLLASGAQADTPDNRGFTPLRWATIAENNEVAALLRRHLGTDGPKK